jgi:hypothetical protein
MSAGVSQIASQIAASPAARREQCELRLGVSIAVNLARAASALGPAVPAHQAD